MDKIRIKRNEDEIYRVNISDDGKEIVFDLLDMELPFKVNKAFEDIQHNQDVTKGKIKAIENKYKGQSGKETENKKNLEIYAEWNEFYKKNRITMDELLGQGTMQALFGDSNYLTMYDDLFEALEPVLEKMEVNVDGVKNRIKRKYAKTEDDTLK